MANWRVINSNMIQTFSKEVFLWDNNEGVAVRVAVPGRPWRNIDNSFIAWMAADGVAEGDFPIAPIGKFDSVKIAYEDGTASEFNTFID